MREILVSFILFSFLIFVPAAEAAVVTFDGLFITIGQRSYGFDGDGDAVDDIVFSTMDPSGFFDSGPGPDQLFINEPALEGTSILDPDLRVDFLFGASDNLSFGYAVNHLGIIGNNPGDASFEVYDVSNALLASAIVNSIRFALPGGGLSSFPEGVIDVSFVGTASYALINFRGDNSRFIIDNFEGNFGSSNVLGAIPEPATFLLIGAGMMSFAGMRRRIRG